ncbi:MAG TPA: DUF5667 domain-containing protein, partial [Ktedonobacteraceae bacterium]|nr:DUF5667 domain-containing protein [Ktedonobacteraceae bacterium]
HRWNSEEPAPTSDHDPEIDKLVTVARHLQSHPQLQADPDFVELLETRLLLHHAALRQKQPARKVRSHFWRAHPVYGIALGFCLLVLALGTGVLTVAARVSNPENPLYAVKRWEQHVQVSLAGSSESRAELDMQFAREQLNMLTDLAAPAQENTYRQTLADFDQDVGAAASAIQSLPAGPDRDSLSSELAALKGDGRRALRGLLPQLALAERLITTDELGHLGDTVPRLLSVEIILSAHPGEHATIIITGSNIQPGAQLLVNGQVMDAQGSFQTGLYTFTTSWNGNQHPLSAGILNPDGTVAQTTSITMKTSNGNGNGNNGNSGGHGNGNNGGKPDKTPTPHH